MDWFTQGPTAQEAEGRFKSDSPRHCLGHGDACLLGSWGLLCCLRSRAWQRCFLQS